MSAEIKRLYYDMLLFNDQTNIEAVYHAPGIVFISFTISQDTLHNPCPIKTIYYDLRAQSIQ